jgi:hypothetical protein
MSAPVDDNTIEGMMGGIPGVRQFGLNTNQPVNFSQFTVDASGNVVAPGTFTGAGVSVGGKINVLAKTTTAVLTAAQSGSLVLWNAAAGAMAAEAMPSTSHGFFYQKPQPMPTQGGKYARFWAIGNLIAHSFRRHGKATGLTTI